MRKSQKSRDDSELPPKREKAQEKREADFIASIGLSISSRDDLENEIRAQLRIIRSDKATLETAKLSERDRALLVKQVMVRIARIKEFRKRMG